MIFTKEAVFKPCSKEEYERGMKNDPFFSPYRRVPIWNNGGGLMDQISSREPDDYRYEKQVGLKDVVLVSSKEAEDKELMDFVRHIRP